MAAKDKTFCMSINFERWRMVVAPMCRWPVKAVMKAAGSGGICWWSKRLMCVSSSRTKDEFFETVIHEVIHAKCPYLTEEEVDDLGQLIAEALQKTREYWDDKN